MAISQKKEKKTNQDRKSNRNRQKNKRGDSQVESYDSPEISNREGGGDIRHPRPPFGDQITHKHDIYRRDKRAVVVCVIKSISYRC